MKLLNEISRLVNENLDETFGIARKLHDLKELSLGEHESVRVQGNLLLKAGMRFRQNVGGLETAYLSFIDEQSERNFFGEKKRKVLALLAEYDALPGMGHACGHNLIAAISVGTFLVLSKFRSEFLHDLVLVGTPGEEHGGGKVTLVKNGFFKAIDGSVMIHPSNKTRISCPMLNMKSIFFVYHGKSAHAAANPEQGINALDAVIQLFNGVNAWRQQMPRNSMVHGIVTDGGVAPNIIPARAEASFCIRALDDMEFVKLEKRILACAEGAAQQTGCRLEVRYGETDYRSFVPNPVFVETYRKALKEIGLKEGDFGEHEALYSSDIGDVSHVMPSIHVELQLQDDMVWHSPPFAEATVGPRAKEFLREAVTLNSLAVYRILTEEGLLEKAIAGK